MKFASLPQLSDAHYRRPLLRTPFYEASRPWIQTDSFIAWTGYSTPGVYSITEHEYFAIRNSCALFDLTPMVKYRISGPDAERYLNRVVTGDMRKLAVDKVVYTLWCDDAGHVIDDGTVFRLGPQEFRLCSQERVGRVCEAEAHAECVAHRRHGQHHM